MRTSLLAIVALSTHLLYSQESKTIPTGMTSKLPHEDMAYKIQYDTFGEGFYRREENRFQYFSSNLEKVWEKELELVDGVGGYNWFVSGSNGEELIIAQYGTAFKVDNIDARLIRINKSGEMKTIDLGALINFRGITGFEFFEDRFTMLAVEATGTVTPYGSTLKFYTHFIHFDYDLNVIGEKVTLPAFTEDEKYNYSWVYAGYENESFRFITTYYLKDGHPWEESKDEGQQKRIVWVDINGKIIDDQVSDLPAVFRPGSSNIVPSPLHFNKDRYKVWLDDQPLESVRFFNLSRSFKKIEIEKDGVRSGNLTAEFYKLFSPKALNHKTQPAIYLTTIVEDRINDNVVLVLHYPAMYKYFVATLNDRLAIAHVMSYNSYEVSAIEKVARGFMFYYDSKDNVYGQLPDDHKNNIFSKINEPEEKVLHNLLDFSTYQLLITDDFKAKTTTVTRFDF